MVTRALKALVLFLLLALPAPIFSQSPYSDAAFRTFISVSVNGTLVTARMTYLNITYFRQMDAAAIAEIEKTVKQTKNVENLHTQGDYSTESFKAEILPVGNASLTFTFEGQNVTDSSGGQVCNKTRTDSDGIAKCDIRYFKNATSGAAASIEDYQSCGYVVILSDELSRGNLTLPSASQTATVCPENVFALSAFGPAIMGEVGSPANLPFCFPAMLIAGLLIAAMYYSGRDPLSLFDITTPKLPKTPSFKVKMQTSPQMLRQVQRRYMMLKKQARRDSVREIGRLARKSGKNVAEAKREMNALYDKTEKLMKNKLSDDEVVSLRRMWADLMEKYKPGRDRLNKTDKDEAYVKRFERSIEFSSGLHMAYLQSHQAWKAMGEARGKTSKGGLWARKVTTPLLDKLANASVGFETSKTGQVLGRIPFVKKVIAAPSKVLDVTTQLRGSRQGLKAIRGEMLGQAAYMLGHTKVGRPIYNAFRQAHVGPDGKKQTGFGRAYTYITGRDWRMFEKKHNLINKRLVEYYDVVARMRQQSVDWHNRMYDELSAKLLYLLPIRANSMQLVAEKMGVSEKDRARLANANALDLLFVKIQEGLKKSKKGAELVRELEELMKRGEGKGFDAQASKVERLKAGLEAGDRKKVDALLAELRKSVAVENELLSKLKELGKGKGSQSEALDMLVNLVDKHSRKADEDHMKNIKTSVADFRKAENDMVREHLLVYMDGKGYYQIVEKKDLKSDIERDEDLAKKYGAKVAALVESPDVYVKLLNIRTADTGQKLKGAISAIMDALRGEAGLNAEDRKMLGQIAADYGARDRLSGKKMAEIAAKLDAMDSLRGAVNKKVFKKFDEAETKMRTWLLDEKNSAGLLKIYNTIGDRFNKRLEERIRRGDKLEVHDLVREGCAFGKNPLELVITKALKDLGVDEKFLYKLDKDGHFVDKDGKRLEVDKDGRLRPEEYGKLVKIFKDMDSLEQFFKKKIGGEAHSAEFMEMLKKRNIDSEALYKAAMVQVTAFAQEWSARNYAAIEIMHGGKNAGRYLASFTNALRDLETSSTVRSHLAYLGGEKEFYRKEMGMSDYRTPGLESAVFTARGWEKLFGFVASKDWGGTSRGEQALHLAGATHSDYLAVMERYKALYLNLINDRSVFYDSEFSKGKAKVDEKDMGKFNLDTNAYDELLKRGYTWQDKKNGLELLMSVDRKSSPMILSGKYLAEGENEIVKKGEIRDYARLLANTMGSYYSTREVGFVVLIKKGDKWVYGDPFLDKEVSEKHKTADNKVTMRKEIMEALVGVRDGKYDPASSPIRVISTKDFVTYAKDPAYKGFFGELGKMDLARERLRSAFYKPGMLAAEFIYGAYSDRMESMMRWYTAQWQVRQTLDTLQHSITDKGGMMDGSKRFKYDEERVDRLHESHLVRADEETRERLKKEMEKLSSGEGTPGDSRTAWWYNWRGRVASRIIGEIGNAESDYHNAKLELRALDRLQEKGEIGKAEYQRLRHDIMDMKEKLGEGYEKAKKEYMGLNRDMIGWVGSNSSTYGPQRTMWNLGIVSKLLDSHFVQGSKDAFYNITESSVMRDPRVAIGASAPGWDHSYYVGYHTGQNVYERARFWATNSLWEQQMRFSVDLVFTVHKWWNDRMSFFARYTSGYPAPVKSDMMYAPTYEPRKTSDYFKALLFVMPFQSRTYSDYFRARWQDAITFSGAGSMLAAYQSLGNVDRYDTPGEGQEKRSWLRRQIDKYGMESEHYADTPYRIATQQRYIDQIMKFEDYVGRKGKDIQVEVDGEKISMVEARDRMKRADESMDGEAVEKYARGMFDAVGKVANLNDRRGRYVREVFSGSDIQEDGSRNRFLDMYLMFHSNVFTPTIPGMRQASPIGRGEWHAFPQVAHEVDKAESGTRLGAMKSYWQAGYDSERGRITFTDQFTTKQDAVSEAYRNDVPVLMHLMKMQSKEIGYSIINAPSLAYINPIWFGLGRKIYKTAIHSTPGLEGFTSTFAEPDWTPGPAKWLRHYMARRSGEIPIDTLDGDYRHAIYGLAPRAIVSEAEKSNSFFRMVRDGVYGEKFRGAPGVQPTSDEAKKDQHKVLGQR